ncbi:unnamed protein product [Laminaria digitata]
MEKRNERPNVGGVSLRSWSGAPSRKGCVVNGQITKASNKRVRPTLLPCHTPGGGRGRIRSMDLILLGHITSDLVFH